VALVDTGAPSSSITEELAKSYIQDREQAGHKSPRQDWFEYPSRTSLLGERLFCLGTISVRCKLEDRYSRDVCEVHCNLSILNNIPSATTDASKVEMLIGTDIMMISAYQQFFLGTMNNSLLASEFLGGNYESYEPQDPKEAREGPEEKLEERGNDESKQPQEPLEVGEEDEIDIIT